MQVKLSETYYPPNNSSHDDYYNSLHLKTRQQTFEIPKIHQPFPIHKRRIHNPSLCENLKSITFLCGGPLLPRIPTGGVDEERRHTETGAISYSIQREPYSDLMRSYPLDPEYV